MEPISVAAQRGEQSAGNEAHRQRLSEIGSRIASVAHEINVPLSLISGSLDTLGQYVDVLVQYIEASASDVLQAREPRMAARAVPNLDYVTQNALPLIDICREGTQRLSHIAQQLRLYARRDRELTQQEVDLSLLLHDAARLAAHGRSRRAEIELDAVPVIVSGEVQALTRAFINLIANALDAAPERPDGRVRIRCAALSESASAAAAVCVTISDNGPGIAPELRQRIFEPFFSTKNQSSGLGLGLAITRDIIEDHGGKVELAEPEGNGATLVVTLPLPGFALTDGMCLG